MKITKKEYAHVLEYFSKFPKGEKGFTMPERFEFQSLASMGYDLAKLKESTLRRLIVFLPHGRFKKVGSPILSSAQKKGKNSLLYAARPHLDPGHWPKVFRNINNNDRAGLRDFGGGQLGVLNNKAMSVNLSARHTWNERKFGDLIIMGPWSAISAAIGDGGGMSFEFGFTDIYAGDVNVEFDRMYTDRKAPVDDRGFYVTYIPGSMFEVADDEGQVVLDPRGELVQLAGGAIAGFAGAGADFSDPLGLNNVTALEVVDAIKSVGETAIAMGENMGIKIKGSKTNKDMHTFVVSIYPASVGQCTTTGKQLLTGKEFFDICKSMASIA